jgi:predicted AlkP superfamily pyrophosphatase or phosphodiesterase
VILLSWDGVRPDDLLPGDLPALDRMRREGARAEKLVPVFPTLTFPNHVSLVTGAPVDRHGIVANSFHDRVRGRFHYENDATWLEAEPLWVTAERQGLRTAVFFWVGSETPWCGTAASLREAPFDEDVSEAKKVERILAWLDLPPAARPRLVLSWWHGADHAGHRFGPGTRQVQEQLRRQDRELAKLLAGLDARGAWSSTTLIVVSDHGMAAVTERVDLVAPLRAHGLRVKRLLPSGGIAHVFLERPKQRREAAEILSKLPGVRAWPGDGMPAELRYRHATRVGDVVALAEPPRAFFGRRSVAGVPLGEPVRGAHGFAASRDDMAAIFLALGRGVPSGARLGVVRALDVAPTVTKLLGIAPPRDSEGSPIAALGAVPEEAR